MAQLDNDVLAEAWSAYRSTRAIDSLGYQWSLGYAPRQARTIEARNRLVLHYASVVRYVAGRVAAGLPSLVDRDDLVSYGQFGLIDAIDSYDPDRGAKFETFAVPRIRGSIIDELRKIDPVPRTVRSRVRELERTRAELQAEFGREPNDVELATSLGLTMPDYWVLQKMVHTSTYASLDENEDDRASVAETTFDVAGNPEDIFGAGEITDLVATAINAMPERYKTILVLYYLQEMTLADIGKVLGVTESRVCQLQSKVLQSLRDSLSHGALAAV